MTTAPVPATTPPVPLTPLAIGLLAGVLATAFEAMAVGTAMPQAARELDAIGWYAWAFSLFVIGTLAGNVLAGGVGDRHGPLPTLAAGLVVFAIGLVVAGLAPTMAQLLVGRLVQGLGAGALNVGLFVVVALAFPEDKRPAMMTGFSAAWILPAFVGPPVAAWVTARLSWHWVFLGVVPLLALAAALCLPPLRALHATHRRSTSANPVPVWVGFALGAAAVALQYAGQRAATMRDLWALGSAVGGVALLALALPRLMPRGFLTFGSGLPAVMATRALAAGAFFAAEAFLPLMLVEARGLSIGRAGWLLTIGAVGWFAGSWLQSRPWLSLGRHQLIVAGTVALAIGITGVAVVAAWPAVPVALAWVVWVFSGLGMGLVIASTGLATMTLSGATDQGRSASALQSGESLGNSIITGAVGAVFAWLHATGDLPRTFGTVLGVLAVLTLVAVANALRIGVVRSGG